MYEIKHIVCILYLFLLSLIDIKKRKIPIWGLIIGVAMSVLFQCITRDKDFILIVSGAMTGIIFIVVSRVTNEKFGYGDSILILALGIFLGFWNILYLLFIAFLLAAVYSIFLLSVYHRGKKESFPFVPFLAMGYVGGMMLGNF